MQKTTPLHATISPYPGLALQSPVLLSIRQFSEKHPAFSQGSLRNLIFLSGNRETSRGTIKGNGLNIALIRIGRKILIDEAKFFQWVDAQQESTL